MAIFHSYSAVPPLLITSYGLVFPLFPSVDSSSVIDPTLGIFESCIYFCRCLFYVHILSSCLPIASHPCLYLSFPCLIPLYVGGHFWLKHYQVPFFHLPSTHRTAPREVDNCLGSQLTTEKVFTTTEVVFYVTCKEYVSTRRPYSQFIWGCIGFTIGFGLSKGGCVCATFS